MQNAKPNNRHSIRWVLAAAIAVPVMGLLSSSVHAQYRVNQDGSARDANNRVGSNGVNQSVPKYGSGVTPDMIIYGNVSNSKYFRGPVGAPDARAFRGNTGDIASDRFIRDSAGGYDKTSLSQQYNTSAYYGEARGVSAPAGYVPTKTTTAYTTNPYQLNGQFSTAATLGSLSTGEGLVPRLGSTINALPTPTAPGSNQSALVMSPLGGIRQLGFGEDAGSNDVYTIRNGAIVPSGSPADRFRTDGQTINKIRGELTDPGQDGLPGKAPVGPEGSQPLGKPLGQPLESPGSTQIKPTAIGGAAVGQPAVSDLKAAQGVRRMLPAAAQQSEQMNELEKRLRDRQGNAPELGLDIQRNAAANKPVKPGTPAAPGTNPPAVPGTVTPGAVTPGAVRPMPAGDPLVIKSLATGVKAKSLADVLTRAETLMKEGKFAEALDQYDLAERAAPNNALITLGRSNAELGASSYRSAETHLRQAIGGESALLLGKYDLKGMIGAERLTILTKDLRDLAANEPRESMASFLLAYIQYNTGNEAEAAGHLNEVDKRMGAPDPVVAKMRELWSLPGGGLNK